MEATDLTSKEYWESDGNDLRLNPRRKIAAEGLLKFLGEECGVSGAVVLATSGSSGGFKFVVLSRRALLASARAVIDRCGMDGNDISLAGLSGFHVGGLGVFARAFLTRGRVIDASDIRWDRKGERLARLIGRHNVTQTSLTPTHLFDIVRNRVSSPLSLRCVLLGGGRMDQVLIDEARELGWPVRVSYGMTEAGSQIATAIGEEAEWLPVLPCWETRTEEDGTLAIRGKPLFSGYAGRGEEGWYYESGKSADGWFVTGDRCEIDAGRLRFLGRIDDLVRISGEFVSVSEVDARAGAFARGAGCDGAVLARPEARRGHELILVLERAKGKGGEMLDRLNEEAPGIERLSRYVEVDRLPRTPIGKLDREALARLAGE